MNRTKRSGITNDPNRPEDREYIVRLIAQIITVSLGTARPLIEAAYRRVGG